MPRNQSQWAGYEGRDGTGGPLGPGAGVGPGFDEEHRRAQARAARRRRAARWGVPGAVLGVAAATAGLVPAFAGSPDLPKISPRDLVAKVIGSDVQQLSGTVRVSTDLGLPQLPSGGAGLALGGPDAGRDSSGADSQSRLTALASGTHVLRVAVDGPDRQRVAIVDRAAEYSIVHDGNRVWSYDSATDTVHRDRAPERDGATAGGRTGGQGRAGLPEDVGDATPQALAQSFLSQAATDTSFSVDGTAEVAGRDAYQLVARPRSGSSTVGSVRIAVDAERGVPLRFTLTPRSGGAAAVDVAFTSVDFRRPKAALFAVPKGAKTVQGAEHGAEGTQGGQHRTDPATGGPRRLPGMRTVGRGWTTVAEIETGTVLSGAGGSQAGSATTDGRSGGAAALLDSVGETVHGSFGTGRLFTTRLVNALVTEDGTLYLGAVDRKALEKAAQAHTG
ncbi:outer membrane lipoprotein carrier protein LolA [Streptomyces sp. NPDC059740]|uniref:LolA family protein n=1 Tax=Streptomyces sp. NPDC059740 TaxID=3346926 RepID=UPI0036558212